MLRHAEIRSRIADASAVKLEAAQAARQAEYEKAQAAAASTEEVERTAYSSEGAKAQEVRVEEKEGGGWHNRWFEAKVNAAPLGVKASTLF